MKILSISFGNFFSFYKEQCLNFSDSLKRLEGDPRFETLPNRINVSLTSVILGPNGSGKTNCLKPLLFLAWFISSSATSLNQKQKIPFDRFRFTEDNKEPSNFSITFEHKEKTYLYDLSIDHTMSIVLYEELSVLNYTTSRFSYIIRRKYLEKNKSEEINKQGINISIRALKEYLRPNCSIVSASKKLSDSGLENIIDAFENIYGNVNFHGRTNSETDAIYEAVNIYESDMKLKNKLIELMSDLDLGISGMRFDKIKYSSLPEKLLSSLKKDIEGFDAEKFKHFTIVNAIHSIENKQYELSLLSESGGTKSLFCLLAHIIPALMNGGVAVIDEVELGLHPYMVEKLVKYFLEPGSNPNRAQLICTTHTANVIELLDGSQILFVEKDEDSLQSEIWKLSDIKGVLPRDNFFKGYLSGRYGAVPKV
jgi:AAA15 family ATPase/GTPase